MNSKGGIFYHSLWAVILCSLNLSAFGQSEVLDLHSAEIIPHAFYTYSSTLVEDEIDILTEKDQRLSFDDIHQNLVAWKDNDTNVEPDRNTVHWAHLALYSDRVDTVLLEFGLERHYTWRDIDYYVINQDSVIASGQSGNRFLPRDKPIRSAVNLAQFPVAQGVNHFYCRLSGFETIIDNPYWYSRFKDLKKKISFYIHDRSTYTTIDAFTFPGRYAKSKRGHFFGTNYFKQGLEVFTDHSAEMTIEGISSNWDDYARFHYDTRPHSDSIYWMRFKIIGTKDGPGNYLFGPSNGSLWNFDSIRSILCPKKKNGLTS